MASNKDILEAQRFNRRRLVTAFSSGTPGGRELEPRSPVGPLLVGVAITVVMLVIAMIVGRFAPQLPSGWENGMLIVEKDSGSRYLSVDGVLHPVANISSARLLAGDDGLSVTEMPASALVGKPRGVQLGIPGAPDSLPSPAALKGLQWSACATGEGQTRSWIGEQPALSMAQTAVVTNAGNTYLIADGKRYLLDGGDANLGVLLALGLDSAYRHPVQADWLGLFPAGSALRPVKLSNVGAPAAGMPARLQTAVVGSIIVVDDETAQRRYLVVGDATIAPLTDTAYRLAQAGLGAAAANPLTASLSEVSALEAAPSSSVPTDWPDTFPNPVPETSRVCASLNVEQSAATAQLAQTPAPTQDTAGAIPSERPGLTVTGGGGALVRASAGGTLGPVALITDMGKSFGLTGDTADTLGRLGYTAGDVTVVPASWLALVEPGPNLSREDALAAGGQR